MIIRSAVAAAGAHSKNDSKARCVAMVFSLIFESNSLTGKKELQI